MAAGPDGKFTYKISDDLPEETLSPEEFKEHEKEVMSFGYTLTLPTDKIEMRIEDSMSFECVIDDALLYVEPMNIRRIRNLLLPRMKQRLKRRKK